VDKVICFYAPKLIGGEGLPMIGDLGVARLSDCPQLKTVNVERLGDDVLVTAYA